MANINWTSNHTKLLDVLAQLYPERDDGVRIASEAGIDRTYVKFSDEAATNWFRIIEAADAQGVLIPLIERAIRGAKANKTLKEVLDVFQGSLGSSVRPGDNEVQEVEVEEVDLPLVQPEGGYLIDKPPVDWVVAQLTEREVWRSKLGTDLGKDESASPFISADRFDKRDILSVRSQVQLKIEYDPGFSLICGRPTLQLLPEEMPVAQLLIMPLERQSVPPSFSEQTLEHNFVANLAQSFPVANLKSSSASTTRKTNRLRLTAELDQRVDNVIINGWPHQSLTQNITVIGIQGYTRDYLLVLTYISQSTANKTEIENQIASLQSLVDSFKLIKPANMEEQERQLRAVGDRRYNKYVELNAGKSIMFQYRVLYEQWKGLNWDNSAESKARVISDAKLLQRAIKAFPFQDEETDSLSQELEKFDQMTPKEMEEWLSGKSKGNKVSRKTAALLLLGICVILAILLLTKAITLPLTGVIFAVALVLLGLVSRGFKK